MAMLLGALAMMGSSGCDALAAPDYAGVALLSLKGVASSSSSEDTVTRRGILAAALWQGTSYRGPIGFSRLALRLEFPEFWIDVVSLPAPNDQFAIAFKQSIGANEALRTGAYSTTLTFTLSTTTP